MLSANTKAGKLNWLKMTAAHTLKIALYEGTARLDEFTPAYTSAGEVIGEGYRAGGKILTGTRAALVDGVAVLDFDDVKWDDATISARFLMIYDDTAEGKPSLCVVDFGAEKSSINGPWPIQFPPPTAAEAMIRIR